MFRYARVRRSRSCDTLARARGVRGGHVILCFAPRKSAGRSCDGPFRGQGGHVMLRFAGRGGHVMLRFASKRRGVQGGHVILCFAPRKSVGRSRDGPFRGQRGHMMLHFAGRGGHVMLRFAGRGGHVMLRFAGKRRSRGIGHPGM
ncbi:hypothetical protein chiPu_0018313 [Chiloscyllium punctatum]|uniref:Uncharacterized protein n=1 Tax=Chiloscyllium punctatum TaxID=137246 RepID=A0A401RMB9_CHIPU|nr:hypothetical protein [Chiloscyllium punctatum]